MRQPAHVGSSRSAHVNRFWEADFELASNVVDAINQHFMRSSPHEDTFDHLVKTGEPVCRREVGLVVVVWLCGACCLVSAQHSFVKKERSHTHESRRPSLSSHPADEIASFVPDGRFVLEGELAPRGCKNCTCKGRRQIDTEFLLKVGMRVQNVRH
jgi:hypothetical protein